MKRLFIIAGEPSGDRLGAALMAGLTSLEEISFDGIGGTMMEAEGLVSRFPMEELSVMGLAEILPRYRSLKRRIEETAEAVIAAQPDALITIDSPDFNLRVARRVKAVCDLRTVHYVAPTVWAWRAGRAERMARVIDQVLALFPFEPPFMEAAGMRCDFVGHPVATEPQASAEEVASFRARHGLGDAPVLLVLPGSRRTEVSRLTPVFGATLGLLARRIKGLRVVIPTVAPVTALVQELTRDWPIQPVILDPRGLNRAAFQADKREAFRAADVALAASGTVSLELAAAETPMVIAYDMNWLTRQVISRMVRVDTVTLVNLVSETRSVPEFIGPDCRPEPIAEAIVALFDAPHTQQEAMRLTMQRLGQGGEAPGLRAARAVLDGLKPTPAT